MKEYGPDDLQKLIREVVEQAQKLSDKYVGGAAGKVTYACIFAQNQKEYELLTRSAGLLGSVIKNTPTGPLFNIAPLDTVAGRLKLLKIRLPDKTRPERGDADFAVKDYSAFKKSCISRPGFKLIVRETSEMIELMDPDFNVRVYFSNPPVDKQYGL